MDSEDTLTIKPSPKAKKQVFDEAEIKFLSSHTFLVMDKHFSLFCAKEDNAYMGSFVNGRYGETSKMSFEEALEKFNDDRVNGHQVSRSHSQLYVFTKYISSYSANTLIAKSYFSRPQNLSSSSRGMVTIYIL